MNLERFCRSCQFDVFEDGMTVYDGKMVCDCKNGNTRGRKISIKELMRKK